jgi:glycosyltransferase involved in cell wall biosynthesis
VMAARAAIETGRPAIVTEHGIYTNERRIEITLADWIYENERGTLSLDFTLPTLTDMWKNSFLTYSSACYEACTSIYTIYSGNQRLQLADGADPRKMAVIPNGVDVERYADLERRADNPRPTVALVGRVVTIKDIKTFIRACGLLQTQILDLQAWIMGPTDEQEDYYQECLDLVRQEGLEAVISFTGKVNLIDYFPHIDVVVLTSISEGQPLVLLEAGAAGIPCVATDVGACWEMIMGQTDEDPPLGAGGVVTALSSPAATADGIRRLLQDRDFYANCSAALRERTRQYYTKRAMIEAYRGVYREHIALPDRVTVPEAA